jgi:hypothetical protein
LKERVDFFAFSFFLEGIIKEMEKAEKMRGEERGRGEGG